MLEAYKKAHIKFSKKLKKIKNETRVDKNENSEVKIFNIFSKITEKFDDRESIKLKLIRAGDPLGWLGVNEDNYTSFKIIFSLIIAVLMKQNKTLFGAVLYGVVAYCLVDWYVSRKKKKRHQLIDQELDALVSSTVDFLEQGFSQSEIFSILADRIDNENPLYMELKRAQVKIDSNSVYKDINEILNDFQDRIGMEEIDNYCLALKQQEEAGKAKRMLKKQLDLIRSENNQKKKRETQHRSNLNSIAIGIFVICIVIIILVPMGITVLQSPLIKN